MDYTEEITDIREINEDIRESQKKIENFETLIQQQQENIQKHTNRLLDLQKKKKDCTFEYLPLIDGKIGSHPVSSIYIYGCDCLTHGKKKQCDGIHQINILPPLARVFYSERLNFNNTRKFSIDELQKLNYLDTIFQTVSDDFSHDIHEYCLFTKQYPNKLRIYY